MKSFAGVLLIFVDLWLSEAFLEVVRENLLISCRGSEY